MNCVTEDMSSMTLTESQEQLRKLFMETDEAQQAMMNPRFSELFEQFKLLQIKACKELRLPEEDDYGNTEYKIKLDTNIITVDRVKHLTTQMTFRLNEGEGTAFYQIGVHDSG